MNQHAMTPSREQMIAFLAAWMTSEPGLTLAAAREEGRRQGFVVSRREYEEARRDATGSATHPEFAAKTGVVAVLLRQDPPETLADSGAAAPAVLVSAVEPPKAVELPDRKKYGTRAWLVHFFLDHPDATFAKSKAAAVADGMRAPTPIDFSRARIAAHLGPLKRPRASKAKRGHQKKPAPRRAAQAKSSVQAFKPARVLTDPIAEPEPQTGDAFAHCHRIIAERESFLAALKAIETVVRRARLP